MHARDLTPWTHTHAFDSGNRSAERSTRAVMWITAAMMVAEIWAGLSFNSMALLADGWHMSSHVLAIGLSSFAYVAARRFASDARFAFGTWKIEVLASFSSALLLLGIAGLMAAGSVERLLVPQEIRFAEAIAVAAAGLVVNIACAVILQRGHGNHVHGPGAVPGHHHDLNLRAAYLHVAADAATSALALVALIGGMYLGWNWLDPVMGLVGAVLVGIWAWGLIRASARTLLDREMDHPLTGKIRAEIESGAEEGTGVADFHLWRVGKNQFACILSLVTHDEGLTPLAVKKRLARHPELAHVTVEIHRCPRSSVLTSGGTT